MVNNINTEVSIIIPVYNAEVYLKQCLNSVITQTGVNIEIICIDDCSSDGSKMVLERIAKCDDRIVLIYNDKNMGQSYSRNRGIEAANGKYLLFVDADDSIAPSTVKRVYDEANEDCLDILGFRLEMILETDFESKKSILGCSIEKNEVIDGKTLFSSCIKNGTTFLSACTFIYRRDFIMKNSIRFKEGILHEDNLFCIECMMNAGRVRLIKDSLYLYKKRMNSTTTSSDNYTLRVESYCVILSQLLDYIKTCENEDFRQALETFIRQEAGALLRLYKEIDSFPKDFRFSFKETKPILSLCKAGLYGGYFPMKLSDEAMAKIRNAETVIIYGAGVVGNGMKELLEERGVFDVKMVISQSKNGQYEELKNYVDKKDTAIVIISSVRYKKEMYKNAYDMGFDNIIIPEY